jgi:hypothetical protein
MASKPPFSLVPNHDYLPHHEKDPQDKQLWIVVKRWTEPQSEASVHRVFAIANLCTGNKSRHRSGWGAPSLLYATQLITVMHNHRADGLPLISSPCLNRVADRCNARNRIDVIELLSTAIRNMLSYHTLPSSFRLLPGSCHCPQTVPQLIQLGICQHSQRSDRYETISSHLPS